MLKIVQFFLALAIILPSALGCRQAGDMCVDTVSSSDCCAPEDAYGLILTCSKTVSVVDNNDVAVKDYTVCEVIGGPALLPPPPPPLQKLTIKGDQSSRCVTVRGDSTANDAVIEIWDCVNAPNQIWIVTPVKGKKHGFNLVSERSGKCITVQGAQLGNEAMLIQYDCVPGGQGNQMWEFTDPDDDDTRIRNLSSNRCMTVHWAAVVNGGYLVIFDCMKQGNENWILNYI